MMLKAFMDFRKAPLVHSTAAFNQFYCQEKKTHPAAGSFPFFSFFFAFLLLHLLLLFKNANLYITQPEQVEPRRHLLDLCAS